MTATHLTDGARARLEDERTSIIEEKLPDARHQIVLSRSAGDISENSDLFHALDVEGQLMKRLTHIERLLAAAPGDSIGPDGSIVEPGVTVTVSFGPDDVDTYYFGSIEEAGVVDVEVLTPASPMGSALNGAAVGDVVSYDAPGGSIAVTVTGIAVPA
jgi:transcription elongation factor GreA